MYLENFIRVVSTQNYIFDKKCIKRLTEDDSSYIFSKLIRKILTVCKYTFT